MLLCIRLKFIKKKQCEPFVQIPENASSVSVRGSFNLIQPIVLNINSVSIMILLFFTCVCSSWIIYDFSHYFKSKGILFILFPFLLLGNKLTYKAQNTQEKKSKTAGFNSEDYTDVHSVLRGLTVRTTPLSIQYSEV